MHLPPAVSVQVGRSYWHALVLLAVVSLGLLSLPLLAWCGVDEFPAWGVAMQALLVLLTSMGAAITWRSSPVGTLRWDGGHWLWGPSEDHPVSGLRVVCDFQSLVLVSLHRTGLPVIWLWLEPSHGSRSGWLALRRALVHSAKHGLRVPTQMSDSDGLRR